MSQLHIPLFVKQQSQPDQGFLSTNYKSSTLSSTFHDLKSYQKPYIIKHKKLKPFEKLEEPKRRFHPLRSSDILADLVHQEELKEDEDDQIEVTAKNIPVNAKESGKIYAMVYKKIDRIVDKKQLVNNTKYSTYASMIAKTQPDDQQPYYLMPRKLGIIQHLKNDTINVNNYTIGDKYAKMLCAGLRSESVQNLLKAKLKNNAFTHHSVDLLCNSLPKNVNEITLEGNHLGQTRSNQLFRQINQRFQNLNSLNLENNHLNDDSLKTLFNQLQTNKKIRILNLSRNQLSDLSKNDLHDFINQNHHLIELYLHWNKFHSPTSQMLTKALSQNQTLKILDLSYNSLGIPPSNFWADFLGSESCILLHLDLSYNNFTSNEIELIALKLENNHSIFGFHFRGNMNSQVDHKGFLIFDEIQNKNPDIKTLKPVDYTPGILDSHRINGISQNQTNKIFHDNCWICEGWVEQIFYWTPGPLDIKEEPIFIHFSHEGYIPIQLRKLLDEQSTKLHMSPMSKKVSSHRKRWFVKRMIPSNKEIKFFFSFPLYQATSISKQYHTVEWDQKEKKKKIIFYTSKGEPIKLRKPQLANKIRLDSKPIIEPNNYGYTSLIESIPRVKDVGGILDYIPEQFVEQQYQQIEENLYYL